MLSTLQAFLTTRTVGIFSLNIHGLDTTHVDALSHVFVRDQMFGGRPTSEVRSDGARSNTAYQWQTVPLIDSERVAELSERCAAHGRWVFSFP